MALTAHEKLQILHNYTSCNHDLPEREIRVLVHLYLNPKITLTAIANYLKTGNFPSVQRLVDFLLNNGYIIKQGKPYWNPHLHAFKIHQVYKITPKSEHFLDKMTRGVFD